MSVEIQKANQRSIRDLSWRPTLARLRKERAEWNASMPNVPNARWDRDIAVYELSIDRANETLERLGEENPERQAQRERMWQAFEDLDRAQRAVTTDHSPDVEKLRKSYEAERAKLADI